MGVTHFTVNHHIHRMVISRYNDLTSEFIGNLNSTEPFNLYMVLRTHRITLSKEKTTLTDKGTLLLAYRVHIKGKNLEESIEIKFNTELDNKKILIESEYPFSHFIIKYDGNIVCGGYVDQFIRNLRSNKIEDNYHLIEFPKDNLEYLNMELLYIGQSQGRKKERTALERLKSHSTVLDILSKESAKDPDCQILIGLINFEPISLMTMMPDSLNNLENEGNPNTVKTFKELLGSARLRKESINILEAALIKYFRPIYNEKFIDTFPSKSHSSYQFYYDNNIHSISVEMFFASMNGARISTAKVNNYTNGFFHYLIKGNTGNMGGLELITEN